MKYSQRFSKPFVQSTALTLTEMSQQATVFVCQEAENEIARCKNAIAWQTKHWNSKHCLFRWGWFLCHAQPCDGASLLKRAEFRTSMVVAFLLCCLSVASKNHCCVTHQQLFLPLVWGLGNNWCFLFLRNKWYKANPSQQVILQQGWSNTQHATRSNQVNIVSWETAQAYSEEQCFILVSCVIASKGGVETTPTTITSYTIRIVRV